MLLCSSHSLCATTPYVAIPALLSAQCKHENDHTTSLQYYGSTAPYSDAAHASFTRSRSWHRLCLRQLTVAPSEFLGLLGMFLRCLGTGALLRHSSVPCSACGLAATWLGVPSGCVFSMFFLLKLKANSKAKALNRTGA